MKRLYFLPAACLLLALPLSAQENLKNENLRTLSADSILTGDARMDSLYRHLPEVMVVGERPVVKASAGKLEYDLPRMIEGRPVDNVYEALKELPGVVEQDGALTLGMQAVTVVLDGKVTNMSGAQLYALLKSLPADRIERVEVMYNAPARYQVRGAMINVRLRHRIGDPGVVQGEVYGKYNQEHEASFEERASLLYNGRKFSADFLYSHSHGESFNTTDKEEAIRDLARLYERMVMRKHTNGGYVHVLDELWKVCEQFNANFIIMYQHVCCKTMAGLQGLFDEQARERGLHLIWVEHDLMDPRTVSRRDMRAKVTNYMRAIIQAEPTDESLIEFEDDITW